MKERVVQFGEGNFLRGFVDYFINELNEKANFDTSVVVVQPLPGGMAEQINAQSGVYTTILRGIENSELVEEIKKNTCISRCINPYERFCQFLALARSEELQFVVSNTTEAGIAFDPACSVLDEPPSSFPAKVTRFLLERYRYFDGAADKGLIFLPCELIDYNGRKLRECILQYIALWGLDDGFKAWVETCCTFTSTLVDRIVTGYPRDTAHEWEARLGYKDALMVTAEYFHLWVIEGMGEKKTLLPLDQYGYNVIFTDDILPYKTRKVRILNGAHTMSVLAAHLLGFETVLDMMNDAAMARYIEKGVFEEIIPTIDTLPKQELESYARSVLERFRNPCIHHRLLDICLNSVAKYKERVLPSLLGYQARFGRLPQILTFSLAALILFYKSGDARDSEAVVSFMQSHSTEEILANTALWGCDLTQTDGLSEVVNTIITQCEKQGLAQVVQSYL